MEHRNIYGVSLPTACRDPQIVHLNPRKSLVQTYIQAFQQLSHLPSFL